MLVIGKCNYIFNMNYLYNSRLPFNKLNNGIRFSSRLSPSTNWISEIHVIITYSLKALSSLIQSRTLQSFFMQSQPTKTTTVYVNEYFQIDFGIVYRLALSYKYAEIWKYEGRKNCCCMKSWYVKIKTWFNNVAVTANSNRKYYLTFL